MKPIIFSTEMVKAILEGRKTMTRRVISDKYVKGSALHGMMTPTYCPYGKVGDKLWVRERFLISKGDMAPTLEEELTKKPYIIYYASDNPRYRDKDKWKPSIFMPRSASRITLEITNIRVERVQEITAMDCIAEGIHRSKADTVEVRVHQERNAFEILWDSINGKKHPWESNPFVWVIEFKKDSK